MEKPKIKGTPQRWRQNILFLVIGLVTGIIGTSLASTLFTGQQGDPAPLILYPSPPPTATYPRMIPTTAPTYPAQRMMPLATVIAPRVNVARIAPNGQYMMVATWDSGQGFLTRHDFAVQANLSGSVSTLVANSGMVSDMIFNASGDRLAVMTGESVSIYGMPEQDYLYHFQGYSGAAFSPDGKWLVLSSSTDGLRILEADTLVYADSVPVAGWINKLAISPDSQRLAVAVADNSGSTRVRVMNMNDLHSTRYSEYAAGNYVFQMAFHPAGEMLAVAADTTLRVFNLTDGSQRFFSLDALVRVRSVAFNPDGTWLAVGGGDTGGGMMGAIYTWRWDESTILRPDESWRDYRILSGHVHDVNSVSFTPDGAYLLSASSDGSVRLWDYRNGGGEISRLQI
jgi:WD40 repeat protein